MFIEGFLTPVPKRKIAAYKKIAKKFAKIWMRHGALGVHECMGVDVKKGRSLPFPQAVKLKAGETVFFSWVVYKSKSHRDSSYKKAMKDPDMQMMDPATWPFDGMRMIFGGFKEVVRAGKK